jgi:hypothetical protein
MALIPPSGLRDVKGISDTDKALIKAFMQGAVYSWVKNRQGEKLAVRDLVGGDNFDWSGTPLQVLYQKHRNAGKDDESAIAAAAIDLGWIVKTVLSEDKRTFEAGKEAGKVGPVSTYRWIGNEP